MARDNLVAGRLDLHRDGYGFVRPNARQASGVVDDIFIPPNEINGAMQGDQVLVELEPPRADGRRLGRIARVLERRNPTVVGIFHYCSWRSSAGTNIVIPFDERMTQPILIPPGQELPPAEEGATPHRVLGTEAAAMQPTTIWKAWWSMLRSPVGPRHTPPVGRVIEVLGDPDDFGVDVEMMIRKHQLPRVFPDNVLAEARRVAHLDLAEVAAAVKIFARFRL